MVMTSRVLNLRSRPRRFLGGLYKMLVGPMYELMSKLESAGGIAGISGPTGVKYERNGETTSVPCRAHFAAYC